LITTTHPSCFTPLRLRSPRRALNQLPPGPAPHELDNAVGVPPPPLQNFRFPQKVCRKFDTETTTNSVAFGNEVDNQAAFRRSDIFTASTLRKRSTSQWPTICSRQRFRPEATKVPQSWL
jgi:hypothetical protein